MKRKREDSDPDGRPLKRICLDLDSPPSDSMPPQVINPTTVHPPLVRNGPPLTIMSLPLEIRQMIIRNLVEPENGEHVPEIRAVIIPRRRLIPWPSSAHHAFNPNPTYIWRPRPRPSQNVFRRLPAEPSFSRANRQLHHEVLEIFYKSGKFVFKELRRNNLLNWWYEDMHNPANINLWCLNRPYTNHLRHIEIHIKSWQNVLLQSALRPFIYTLQYKPRTGTFEITRSGFIHFCNCSCLEDDAVDQTLLRLGQPRLKPAPDYTLVRYTPAAPVNMPGIGILPTPITLMNVARELAHKRHQMLAPFQIGIVTSRHSQQLHPNSPAHCPSCFRWHMAAVDAGGNGRPY